jgi:hypothetical protein
LKTLERSARRSFDLRTPNFWRIRPSPVDPICVVRIKMAQRVSVLVDGDNISGKHAGRILSVAARQGDVSVVRVYLAARPALHDPDPRGTDEMVRFRPEGFAHAA